MGQENSRGASRLIEGTSALFLNYPAINIKSVTHEYRAEIHFSAVDLIRFWLSMGFQKPVSPLKHTVLILSGFSSFPLH